MSFSPFEETRFNDIVASSIISEDYNVGHTVNRSTPKQHMLLIVASGKITLKTTKNTYQLKEKDCIMIFPNETFSITASEITSNTISMGFYGEKSNDFVLRTKFTPRTPVFHIPDVLFNFILSSTSLIESKDFGALSLLYLIFSYNNNNSNNKEQKKESNKEILLKNIKKYINDNIESELPISEIAQNFSISRMYLYKIFVDILNITPKEYIVNKKMRKAYKLLKNNDTPIHKISESLGYKDQFVFSKAFKKTYSLSPRDVASGKVPYINILDDENGECVFPAEITTLRHYKGNHSLMSRPYLNEKNQIIEGWLVRAGYYNLPPLPRSLNIATLTDYGKKGALSFMIFVERQTDITNWCIDDADWIRFGSSTDWDTDFQYWLGWHKQIVKEGWNQIILPFGQSKWGNVCGNPDYTNFNSFAIVLSIPTNCRCFLDDIKVIADY